MFAASVFSYVVAIVLDAVSGSGGGGQWSMKALRLLSGVGRAALRSPGGPGRLRLALSAHRGVRVRALAVPYYEASTCHVPVELRRSLLTSEI